MKKIIAVIIPIYKPPAHWEESCLEHMLAFQTLHPEYDARFVLVNDGSERSVFSSLLSQMEKTSLRYEVFHLKKNYGKGKALRHGISKVITFADCIVGVDWDFPFGVRVIGEMGRKILSGENVVLADRGVAYLKKLPKRRALVTIFWRKFLHGILRIHLPDSQAGVKAFSKESAKIFSECEIDSFLSDFEFLLRLQLNKIVVSTLPVVLRGDVKLDNFSLKVYLHELKMLMRLLYRYYVKPLNLKIKHEESRNTNKSHLLHVDDFGMSSETNSAIKKAISAKVVGSVSVMTNMPAYEDAVQFLKKHPNLRVGLHFNITEEAQFSYPFDLIKAYLLGRYTLDQLETDLYEQFKTLQSSGITVSHLDSHQHIHAFLPFYQVFHDFAEKNNIPYVRGCRLNLSCLRSFFAIQPTFKQILICFLFTLSNMLSNSNRKLSKFIFDLNWHNQFSRKRLKTVFKAIESDAEIFCHISDRVTSEKLSKERFACYAFILSPGFKKFWEKYAKLSSVQLG